MSGSNIDSIERVIGEYGDASAGTLVIVVAGLHGNEHGGIIAARRLVEHFQAHRPGIHGRFIAIAGNLKALKSRIRFIDRDLNRVWGAQRISRLRTTDPSRDNAEDAEQRALLEWIESEIDGHKGRVVVVDLHSTSAAASPFCIISDTLQNRGVAFALGVPVILGLEEAISGTIQEFFGDRGFIALAIEGGQHDDPATADRLESALWLALQGAGLIQNGDVPSIDEHRRRLHDACVGLPDVVEVRFRHGIEPDDGFNMREGFENFSPIRRGDLVASDSNGEILAPHDGMLILPSYQRIGDDGFFVGKKVKMRWLRLSTWVRRVRLDRHVHLLPGVHRDPADFSLVMANPRVTRWLALKFFHLAGFRNLPDNKGLLVFKRRAEH
jgi:succinylglutamate desuccinylase